MGIRFTCNRCNTALNVKESQAGQPGQCPYCDNEVQVPTESTIAPKRKRRRRRRKQPFILGPSRETNGQASQSGLAASVELTSQPNAESAPNVALNPLVATETNSSVPVISSMVSNEQSDPNSLDGEKVSEVDVFSRTNGDLNSSQRLEELSEQSLDAESLDETLEASRAWEQGEGESPSENAFSESSASEFPNGVHQVSDSASRISNLQQIGQFSDSRNGSSSNSSVIDEPKPAVGNGSATNDLASGSAARANRAPAKTNGSPASTLTTSTKRIESPGEFNLDKPTLEFDGKHPIRDFPTKIWYVRGKKLGEKGPLKAAELEEMLEERVLIKKGYIVWREDWIDWQPAELVFPELNEPPEGSRAFTDPNYRIPDELNPHSELSRRRRFKKTFGIIAIGLSFVTIIVLSYVLLQMMG